MKNITAESTIIQHDLWLEPYFPEIKTRLLHYRELLSHISDNYGSLKDFAGTHKYLGFVVSDDRKSVTFREWAPEAKALYLTGDFNDWDLKSHPLKRIDHQDFSKPVHYGLWEITIPFDNKNEPPPSGSLSHGSKVKVCVESSAGFITRLPSHIHFARQFNGEIDFTGVLYNPRNPYCWENPEIDSKQLNHIKNNPLIYECHAGMAQEKEGVGTWREFADNLIPYIKDLGYNIIQLMGVLEHPYYGSYGYHVSNYFAPSSRFGTPDDLKYLIDKSHAAGIAVVCDMVHSHCVKNLHEGLNLFDGTDYQYFHAGERGEHKLWDSKIFNYGKREVQAFLLSSLRYWIEEFHFDGFRFDGVTSMLYQHHGQNKDFGHYDLYFKYEIDTDAVTYLQLANTLIKSLKENAVTVAEDMSGMPGLGRPPEEGGLGFDFRLAMGMPDQWIKILKEKRDEEWDLNEIWNQLKGKRPAEKVINYCESHDQALVGDKTIAFRLMDQEMYWHMSKDHKHPVIERGVALHKLIRLLSIAVGGDGWLCFMGNEFGHPEWIDFPREGNGYSYKYARRQWSLCKNPHLWYYDLCLFDRAMVHLFYENELLKKESILVNLDVNNKVLAFEKGNFLFVFNFSIDNAISGYEIGVGVPGVYNLRMCSDDKAFGGEGRIEKDIDYPVQNIPVQGKPYHVKIYTVPRSAAVFELIKSN